MRLPQVQIEGAKAANHSMINEPLAARANVRAKPKRARWYFQSFGECPVCGRPTYYREARYTIPPPKEKRYEILSDEHCYDYCLEV